MSFFNKILSALGIGHAEASTQTQASPDASTAASTASAPSTASTAAAGSAAPASAEQISAKLESLAKDHPTLKPKESIVDLLKALNLPDDFASRKQLAGEVGVSSYEGTAEQNIELHKAVLAKAAQGSASV
ncbi:DUF3597 family protein [Pseudomonas sp. LP_7_YM]|uniref:DUF3597 family protein n=1 Tax=Pseudomonas sp. LP_7_YM TaxID=2485137 RepID=UPI00105C83EF|nr:DUF3597 family protein [Pseudomonas sp. LP_7_YM]TDV64556.1 uncharacterized protein DUF3597 [Pseudomonas sp. LP_7_YM]